MSELFKATSGSYWVTHISNYTINDASVFRATNISSTNSYDLKIRTEANNDASTIGWIVIGPKETVYIRKDPAHFVHTGSGNVYSVKCNVNPSPYGS